MFLPRSIDFPALVTAAYRFFTNILPFTHRNYIKAVVPSHAAS